MDELDIIAKTAMDRLIKVGDFCEVVSDKFVDHGTKRGHVVYVTGSKAIPENAEDLYNQRIKFMVLLMNRDGHVDTSKGIFLMDPRSIQKVSPKKQEMLTKIFESDFGEDDETTN